MPQDPADNFNQVPKDRPTTDLTPEQKAFDSQPTQAYKDAQAKREELRKQIRELERKHNLPSG